MAALSAKCTTVILSEGLTTIDWLFLQSILVCFSSPIIKCLLNVDYIVSCTY